MAGQAATGPGSDHLALAAPGSSAGASAAQQTPMAHQADVWDTVPAQTPAASSHQATPVRQQEAASAQALKDAPRPARRVTFATTAFGPTPQLQSAGPAGVRPRLDTRAFMPLPEG